MSMHGVCELLYRSVSNYFNYKNKNFIDPETETHSNIKFGASIFGKSKTNKKYNCACNMTFTGIFYSSHC